MKFHFCVYKQYPTRVDLYLSTLFSDFSRSFVQKMIDRGMVLLNGKEITKNTKIKNRDEVMIDVVMVWQKVISQDIPLDIVYEDESIVVINKDPGINSHPTPSEYGKVGTLVNAVLFHCKWKLPSISWEERPGIVHRLDKDTSGLIMVAKDDLIMRYLQGIIRKRKIEKYYYAIVYGTVKEKDFKIESFIGRHPNDKTKMTTKNPINPKLAITYGKIERYLEDGLTLLKLKLETGRTHQIRVHLASIWYPIVWDKVYGNEEVNKKMEKIYWLKRQALHAYELKLKLYGRERVFIAPLKKDMLQILWDKTKF